MFYFYKMLYLFSKEKEQKEQKEQKEKEQKIYDEQKISQEEIFFSHLELKYNIYGKVITLEHYISSILKIISNKPRLYSINKKKHISLFHYELTNYYQLYLIIHKEFEFIKNEFCFRKKFVYLKSKNNYVFNYIQDKYHLFTIDYIEEMKNVPELLDLKNNVIRLVYEVMLKLQR